uniref:Fibrinogen C-terminal domain-containing protein n=1 Tax=Macrostomum lignano TaxID=282301 RepID=A0A1I8IGB2_9PLAT
MSNSLSLVICLITIINLLSNATRMVGCDLAVNWRKIGEDLSEYRLMKQAAEIGHLAQCLLSADNTSEAVWYSSHNRTCHEFVCNRGPNGCRKCRNAIRADATVTQVWIRAQPSGQFNCWKTFQHRVSSNLSFDKNWTDYSTGFGLEEADNFWLGLEQIHQLTKHRGRRVRWELSDWDKKWYWTENFNFTVSGPEDKYRAVIGEFDSAASSIGQAMTTSDVGIQGNQFSTPDSDNDLSPDDCALERRGGWWFGYCTYFNPNGIYFDYPTALSVHYTQMPMMYHCDGCPSPLGQSYSLRTVECMIEHWMP